MKTFMDRNENSLGTRKMSTSIRLDQYFLLVRISFDLLQWLSSIAAKAARRPGAPMTPPPGCAPLPQRYRFLNGVR